MINHKPMLQGIECGVVEGYDLKKITSSGATSDLPENPEADLSGGQISTVDFDQGTPAEETDQRPLSEFD
jgi:hypothetical protein